MIGYLLPSVLALAESLSAVGASPIEQRATLACDTSSIPQPDIFGLTITSLTAELLTDYLGIPGNDQCNVNITTTHTGAGDSVNNWLFLPVNNWNGIFQGVGGGGFVAGFYIDLAAVSAEGYACISTDAGHTSSLLATGDSSSWALISPGNVDQYAALNFGYRSYHEMTLLGKAITASFYGSPAKYAYWNGCSTGGRQGMSEAQRFPEDYDGILAEAPAIQWTDFTFAQQWPFTVMNNENYAPLQCEFTAINKATIECCDGLDGVMDGIISAPALCDFNPDILVGKAYTCDTDGTQKTFNQKTADIVNLIWQGPRTPQGKFLWYGITKGTNFSTLASTTVAANGSSVAVAFPISDTWYRDFVAKQLDFDTALVTYPEFTQAFLESHLEWDSTFGTYSPNLRAFKRAGGKLLTWQGLADNLINPQGTMLYYEKVLALDPTAHTFYRQFYSPGVGHCGGGTGVTPLNAIGALRAWVENGTAPATLSAASEYPVGASSAFVTNGTNVRFLELCPYPMVNKYVSGDLNLATSYECARDMGFELFGGPSGTNCSYINGPGWY
ncbi:tannase and feruloyl esterase [Lophium mytilinum]|uniref:Carboxylic ester hydrolase n=1 Tax=Lophium mytilinum TaxID=390894 RepID=A0A6A6QPM0_9PEZI|nr:tannase and feruloyl esterase [Lophium mytilinum]